MTTLHFALVKALKRMFSQADQWSAQRRKCNFLGADFCLFLVFRLEILRGLDFSILTLVIRVLCRFEFPWTDLFGVGFFLRCFAGLGSQEANILATNILVS
jgi:hypothetical protein